ncbi:unnamed protein product [Thlaspi arvense]|uniref:Uncharacterized protein n=1 Tax=Thlaspi arvense TaxID=13288 RepID=A0AAU9RK20_THLAR|nr:unnamed protein product [Thlaspi arvense]
MQFCGIKMNVDTKFGGCGSCLHKSFHMFKRLIYEHIMYWAKLFGTHRCRCDMKMKLWRSSRTILIYAYSIYMHRFRMVQNYRSYHKDSAKIHCDAYGVVVWFLNKVTCIIIMFLSSAEHIKNRIGQEEKATVYYEKQNALNSQFRYVSKNGIITGTATHSDL